MHSAFILVSDRVSNGEKQDKITPIVGERLAAGRAAGGTGGDNSRRAG